MDHFHIRSQGYMRYWSNHRRITSCPFLRKCELDLGRTFSEGQSIKIIQSIFKTATCTKIEETNYKIISQWYRTPAILQRCFPNITDKCWRCQLERGLYYIFFGLVLELGHFGGRFGRPSRNSVILKIRRIWPTYCTYRKSWLKPTGSPLWVTYWMQLKPVYPRCGNRHSLLQWECGLGRYRK